LTDLNKPLHRSTAARRREAGKVRAVIITLAPPAQVGFRLQGTRQTFWLDAESAYELAVRAFVQSVEREARKIVKTEGVTLARARAIARRRLKG
jgi:hypothetical protein